MNQQKRLVTKSNIDGMVSAILLDEIGMIEDVLFVEEKDIKHGDISLLAGDVVVNLPFVKGVHQSFSYHDSTDEVMVFNENHIYDCCCDSCAALIYDYYHDSFGDVSIFKELVESANRESTHTLTTKNRLDVYKYYENRFEKKLQEA